MRQLLVECSDPGLVVTLEEEFENVLRHVDFERAKFLQGRLSDLARELGTEFEEAWRGVRIDGAREPCCFGSCEFRHNRTDEVSIFTNFSPVQDPKHS